MQPPNRWWNDVTFRLYTFFSSIISKEVRDMQMTWTVGFIIYRHHARIALTCTGRAHPNFSAEKSSLLTSILWHRHKAKLTPTVSVHPKFWCWNLLVGKKKCAFLRGWLQYLQYSCCVSCKYSECPEPSFQYEVSTQNFSKLPSVCVMLLEFSSHFCFVRIIPCHILLVSVCQDRTGDVRFIPLHRIKGTFLVSPFFSMTIVENKRVKRLLLAFFHHTEQEQLRRNDSFVQSACAAS